MFSELRASLFARRKVGALRSRGVAKAFCCRLAGFHTQIANMPFLAAVRGRGFAGIRPLGSRAHLKLVGVDVARVHHDLQLLGLRLSLRMHTCAAGNARRSIDRLSLRLTLAENWLG